MSKITKKDIKELRERYELHIDGIEKGMEGAKEKIDAFRMFIAALERLEAK